MESRLSKGKNPKKEELYQFRKGKEPFRSGQQYLETIFDSIPDGVIVSDINFDIIFCNRAAQDIFGYSQDELAGKKLTFLVSEEDSKGQEHERRIKELLEKGSFTSNYLMKRKNGEKFSGNFSAAIIKDGKGEPYGLVGVIKDETIRKIAHDSLRINEERYRNLVELTSDIIYLTDAQGNHIFMNEPGFDKLGATLKDVIGQPWLNWIHPEDRDRSQKKFRDMMEKGIDVFNFENRYVTKGGKEIYVLQNVRVLKNGQGSVIGTQGIARDITDRKIAEDEIREKEENLRHLIESSPDCICHISLEGKFLGMNTAGCRLNELESEKEIIGKACSTNIIENRGEMEEALKRARKGEVSSLQYKSESKSGKEIWWDSKVTPIRKNGGDIEGILRISRDITEKKKAEAQLRKSREFLNSIIENSGDSIITTNIEGKITLWSAGARNMFGYTQEEILGKNIEMLYPEELQEERKKWQKAILAGEIARNIRTQVYNSNGELVNISLTLSPMLDMEGNPVGTIGVSKDITDVLEAEKKLTDKIEELEKWQKLTVGREVKMVELKKEIQDLKKSLELKKSGKKTS